MDHLNSAKSTVVAFSRWLAISQLLLMAVTWRLWTPQSAFPQVPLIRAACDWPAWIDWAFLAVQVVASLLLLVAGGMARTKRVACVVLAICWGMMFTLDQHRLQPWAWQFYLLAIVLSLSADLTAIQCCRWLALSIYFWSAISKLDSDFFHQQGPALIGGLKQAIGIRVSTNPGTGKFDVWLSVGLAVGELLIAIALARPGFRRIGLWAATVMHLILMAALGPRGLNHSWGVLLWNVYFIGQDWILFRQRFDPRTPAETTSSSRELLLKPRLGVGDRIAACLIGAMALWPAVEPLGRCDHWLAWAVYSPRSDRCRVLELQNPAGNLVEVNLGRESLNLLNVPIYPQLRFQVGVELQRIRETGATGYFICQNKSGVPLPPQRQPKQTDAKVNELIVDLEDLETWSNSFFWNAKPRQISGPPNAKP